MKKSLLMMLTLVSAMALPSFASLSFIKADSAFEKMAEVRTSESPLKETTPASLADSDKPNTQLLLTFNDHQSKKVNLLATTELKINLDNFDMEYVLKVQ